MYALIKNGKILAISDDKTDLSEATVINLENLEDLKFYSFRRNDMFLLNYCIDEIARVNEALSKKDQEKEKLEIDCGGLETRIAELRAEISKISGPVVDMIKEKGKEIFEKLNKENKDKTDPPKPKDPVAELGKMFSKIGDYLRNDC
jgi:septal ring factor EnvC (AmiA/AmiB activator)